MNSPLQGGRMRRGAYRRKQLRRRRVTALLAIVLPVAGVAAAWFLLGNDHATVGRASSHGSLSPPVSAPSPAATPSAPGTPYAVELEGVDAFHIRFNHPPRAALVFDLTTGRVLWRRNPLERLPVASLTKLMTALLVVEHKSDRAQVRITRDALHYSGSGVGLLPKGKRVSVRALLYGLLLPSGNDAAIALADGVAHTRRRFVTMMNAKAASLGLRCTHFVSPHGLEPGNRSCPADLAALSRIVLGQARIARIVRAEHAIVRFPIKGGKLYLYNTNPLLRVRYPGTIGLKTGDTDAAGHCLIAVVRRGPLTIAAILLKSPNPAQQAEKLFARAFRVDRP